MTLRRLLVTLTVLASWLFARAARAEPERILVAAGSNAGLPAERPLRFAGEDAKRVRDVMVSLGGVRPEHAFLVTEPTRAALYAAIDRAKAEARRHRVDEVTLVFYFSGHGDREAIHLDGDRLPLGELSAKLGEVPASLRIAVTDACRATRDKGFAADEPFSISTTLIPQASGQVWLHASSDGEAAQESDDLQGAIFTNAWVSGLRGAADLNGDSRVTLDESFSFAHAQTLLRSAKSSGVMQKPEAVMNLHEHAPIVITQTASRLATLVLPKAADTYFLVYAAEAKTVLSELWGSPERRLSLKVPPGRYVVHRRLGTAAGAAQIAIAAGEERALEDRDFAAAASGALAKKGNPDEEADRPPSTTPPAAAIAAGSQLSAGYDVGGSSRTGFIHGPRAGFAHGWGTFALVLGGGADFTGRSLPDQDEKLTSAYGRAGLELRRSLGAVTLHVGGGARAGVVWQTLTPASGAPAAGRSAFAAGPEVAAGARLHVGPTWFFDLTATGGVSFLRQDTSLDGVLLVTGAASVGLQL